MGKWTATAKAHSAVKSKGSKCNCTVKSSSAVQLLTSVSKTGLKSWPESKSWEAVPKPLQVIYMKKAHKLMHSAWDKLLSVGLEAADAVKGVEFSSVLTLLLESLNVRPPVAEGSRTSRDVIMCEFGLLAEQEEAKTKRK